MEIVNTFFTSGFHLVGCREQFPSWYLLIHVSLNQRLRTINPVITVQRYKKTFPSVPDRFKLLSSCAEVSVSVNEPHHCETCVEYRTRLGLAVWVQNCEHCVNASHFLYGYHLKTAVIPTWEIWPYKEPHTRGNAE